MTNELLTEGLKNKQYQDLYTVLLLAKEIIDKGKSLTSTNEQLIVVMYNLNNIKDLYNKINELGNLDNDKLDEYKKSIPGFGIKTTDGNDLENSNVSEDELIGSLNQAFEGFKSGFGTILAANILLIITAIISYLSISSGSDLSDIKDTANILLGVNFVCYIIFLLGIIILYNSSELKKKKKF
jgi:hypothetical protein